MFPYRAFVLNPNISKGGLICLRDERMLNVKKHCKGKVLDVGCGPDNVFVSHYLDQNSIGVDFHLYPGLKEEQIIKDPLNFPFEDKSFDTITLIANINHIPEPIFKDEITELCRMLKADGRIIVTRIGQVTSFLTHNVVHLQSMISKSYYSMDHDRGMEEDERLSVSMKELNSVFASSQMQLSIKDSLWTQWNLNEILVYERISKSK